MIATAATIGFDPGTFVLESGLLELWALQARDHSIRFALSNAGFECRRLRRVLEHRLVIVDADCDRMLEFRPSRVIKASVLRSFRQQSLLVRPELYSLRSAGMRLVVSIAVFEQA